MDHTVGDALFSVAAICGAFAIILTFLTVVAKLRPVRWFWRRTVSGPIADYATAIIKDGALQFHEETVRPVIDQLSAKVETLVELNEQSWVKDKAWMVGRVERAELRLEQIDTHQQQLVRGVIAVLEKGDATSDVVRRDIVEALMGATRPILGNGTA